MKKIYLFALLFAILTGLAVFAFTSDLQSAAKEEQTGVVVALKNIPERTLITTDMVGIKPLPAQAVHSNAALRVSDVVGKIAGTDIVLGEQVLMAKLSERNVEDSGLACNVPEGKRAYSIEVDDTSGVAGYLCQGDRVDIVASLILSDAGAASSSKSSQSVLLLQNIEVLVTSTAMLNEKGNGTGYTIITLAVTPEEALKLFHAQVNGRITVTLRPDTDTNVVSLGPYKP